MIKAIKDTIIVRQEYQEKVGGVVIPESAKKFQLYDGKILYIVVSVGPDYPYKLNPGDRVCIRRHEGVSFKFEGVEYFKVKEQWVEGIYE